MKIELNDIDYTMIKETILTKAETMGKNAYELGCKFLYRELELVDSLIDTSKDVADNLYDAYIDVYTNNFDNDVIAQIRGEFAYARQTQVEAEEYRAAIRRMIREWKETATPDQIELARARSQVFADNRIKTDPALPAGARKITKIEKPIMKGYKIMRLMAKDIFGKKVVDLANRINLLLKKPDHETTDEFRERCGKIREAFFAMKAYAEKLLAEKITYKVSADKAKINAARQSQLADMIGVKYGETSDCIISVEHNIANLFDDDVCKYIAYGDREEGLRLVTDVKSTFVQILKDVGIDLKLFGTNGRIINFRFWDANNAQLKNGNAVMLSKASYDMMTEIYHVGKTADQYNQVKTTGPDELKKPSYAMTPGCPMRDDDGNIVTINDVLLLDDVVLRRWFENVLVIDKNGKYSVLEKYLVERAMADGLMLLLGIPTQQARGALSFKGLGVRIANKEFNMVDEIARREGLTVPEVVIDIDMLPKEWRKYKIIATKSCWKLTKNGVSFNDFRNYINKVAEKYPAANRMYTARLADSTEEESKRKAARQLTQQFLNAKREQIAELLKGDVRHLKKLATMPGILAKFAGLHKKEEERTAFEHLIEAKPDFLAHPLMKLRVAETFDRALAEAAMRPSVHGRYPYLVEDPVAAIKILLFGMNPDTVGLGYLRPNEINIPECAEGKEIVFVRYPSNHLVSMIRVNHNDPIYDICGNVCILSIDGDTIVRADGDFDGDEGLCAFDEIIVELCKQLDGFVKMPLIVFPHDKMEPKLVTDDAKRSKMIADAVVIANRYGSAVGQNSNFATKCFNAAANAKTASERSRHLMMACWAHVAAILAIDLAKTGEFPKWLQPYLKKLEDYKTMPWNQRFQKHSVVTPWYALGNYAPEGKGTPDGIGRYLLNIFGLEPEKLSTDENGYAVVLPSKQIDIKTDMVFNEDDLFSNVKSYRTGSVLPQRMFRAIEARNYRTKPDGDDELKLVSDLKAGNEVGFNDLFRFLFRNRSEMVYKLGNKGDKTTNAEMRDGYYEFVYDVLVEFSKNGTNRLFQKLSEEDRMKVLCNAIMKLVLSKDNGIGKNDTDAVRQSKQSRFLEFAAKVIAYPLYCTVAEKTEIKDRWVKTEATPEEVDEDCGEYSDCGVFGY